ncbi:type IV pilus twitching motility protein PilT [Stratiformator vulcanicus]|uniref:Twitching mobility protein n=1 Tax=Stratiformator vulcanicus TaxID=2527980 RepID=A0A517QYI0_9PLAN|nr:PilT/PilU family type 4a pilus ATPase [Stratiformator vulcanicus]QDT36706.1 Twitching mobility protein [Stratiformator vulcanicus]
MQEKLNTILNAAVEAGASDVLLASGVPPIFRVSGTLRHSEFPRLDESTVGELCRSALTSEQQRQLEEHRDVDFGYEIEGGGRFRFNVHYQRRSLAAAARLIADRVPALADLNLPPVINELTLLKSGLLLVCGATGSGKSTTLAAMIAQMNERDQRHIITLEDPIEFVFEHEKSIIEQRQIGIDCPSFASGLRHVLRQDPDVILVGELRDADTIRTALQAAETGHLVLATLHASSATGAIDRVIEVFGSDEQAQVRSHLAESLSAVIAQQLLPDAAGTGRVAAQEILIANRPIRTSIRENTPHLIPGMIATSRKDGMQTMEQSLKELLLNGRIRPEAAGDTPPLKPGDEIETGRRASATAGLL